MLRDFLLKCSVDFQVTILLCQCWIAGQDMAVKNAGKCHIWCIMVAWGPFGLLAYAGNVSVQALCAVSKRWCMKFRQAWTLHIAACSQSHSSHKLA